MIIVVNMIKQDTKSDEERADFFTQKKAFISAQLKKAGANPNKLSFVPVDAHRGDNVSELSASFCGGQERSLMGYVEALQIPKRALQKPLRILIDSVYRIGGWGTVACGKIESGTLDLNCQSYVIGNGDARREVRVKGIRSVATPYELIKKESVD